MNIAIIISTNDPAGMNIKSFLDTYELPENVSINVFEELSIENEDVDKKVEADVYLFATTHRSKAGKPSLTTHVPGNWTKAGLGGRDNELCIAPALFIRKAFLEIIKQAEGTKYEPIMEVTHHGPYLEKPCFFMEIGSSENEWKDKVAGERQAKAIYKTLTSEPEKIKTAVGIGGLHNVPVLSKYVERGQIALGHVCPKYMLEHLDENNLKQAIERTVPKAELIVVDWKGLGEHKQKVRELCEKVSEELGIEWKRSDKM